MLQIRQMLFIRYEVVNNDNRQAEAQEAPSELQLYQEVPSDKHSDRTTCLTLLSQHQEPDTYSMFRSFLSYSRIKTTRSFIWISVDKYDIAAVELSALDRYSVCLTGGPWKVR